MTSPWPHRPVHELPPPPSGLRDVRRAAGRRRRRTAVLSSAATAMTVLAAFLLLQVGAGDGGRDSLRVTDNTPAAPSLASHSPLAPQAVVKPATGRGPQPVATAQSARPAAVTSPRAGGPPPSVGHAGPYRAPDLVRTYIARPTPNGVTVCSGSSSATGSDVQYTVNWCEGGSVASTAGGHDLVGEACRDSSADAQLTYQQTREIVLTVENAEGRVVWTSTQGRPAHADAHRLTVAREHCWAWTAAWTDVDTRGRTLPSGAYTLVVAHLAQELASAPETRIAFSL